MDRRTLNTIYHYGNYREYLAAYIREKKTTVRGFSLRQFAKRAGISKGNYLGRILRCERNLGPRQTEKFIRAMALGRAEAEYFQKLVSFEHAEGTDARIGLFDQLEGIRKQKLGLKLKQDEEFYRHWYTAVIFELASCRDFDAEPAIVARSFKGRIKPGEAKQVLTFLQDRGYLERDSEGRLRQKSGVSIGSSQFTTNLFLRASHRKMSELAAEAVDMPTEERTFQGVSLALSSKQMPAVKRKLLEFAEELIREFGGKSASPEADRVYQFNFQAFPVAVQPRLRVKNK